MDGSLGQSLLWRLGSNEKRWHLLKGNLVAKLKMFSRGQFIAYPNLENLFLLSLLNFWYYDLLPWKFLYDNVLLELSHAYHNSHFLFWFGIYSHKDYNFKYTTDGVPCDRFGIWLSFGSYSLSQIFGIKNLVVVIVVDLLTWKWIGNF